MVNTRILCDIAIGFIAYTAQDLVGPSGTGEWDAALVARVSLVVLILGFVHLCQYVEEQAGQVLEDLEPTTHETHLRQGNSR